ncbi:pilin outer membrane usher protein SafC [Erwinia sp. OLTSP20]|uniref:fimbria/pilus outer membrane usher protein n=1 Tax=unclassified Erwinia TaxID=2622719 RepID=UPI000C1A6FFB|nr:MULTISPECIES: fimbria/pilus outer membrane usher protein [unclassified Erwinia]PIJ48394.1 pilin outer membrane usher protein SafC [Erwinia sp. OAMSP11]PIJ67732.1 pilin outer membrane usher protein SafC [Erwinia sp. OLSSP12]PIJ78753.1 pilin outer membrane usher protein SafC [Erwinia sp. OLCASP19]PIJ79413.1 pilin outer membrane usher protein SafC [Erwinia sp. OLMTSP26]PIJ81284.1 pilin outer membrane usher protein SafC [Erwinia sp. OLMDSP33]
MEVKVNLLVLAVALGCMPGTALAREYTFDPAVLGLSGKNVDMTLINQGGQLPGTYSVDILVNGQRVDSREVVFARAEDAATSSYLSPCLSVEMLSRYGVLVDKYFDAKARAAQCVTLSAIPGAKANFPFYSQQLLLNIPQVSLRPRLSGIAPRQLWNDGIPAVLLDYNANATRTEYRNGYSNSNNNSAYVQLNPGANLGPWRLRNQTNWQKQGNAEGKWQSVYTYADRGLYDMKSRLTMGERTTPGDVFDSVPFRGVMLGSDDNMVPYNQRVYAPVVRGIARTQARVEVKQNGYTVYSQTVASGPFALTDLSLSGGGGDLQVTVWETDGNPQVFTVPYQTPAISLREGYLKYNVMTGRYRPASSGTKGSVVQGTLMYGLPWDLTVYGGGQVADHYQVMSLGLGLSMGEWGALSVDGTGSHARRRDEATENGGAWRVRYSKEVIATQTTLTMTSYQYASAGYNTLSDVLNTWGDRGDQAGWYYLNRPDDRRKSTTSLSLSQSMGQWGYLSLNGQRSNYWNRDGHDDSYGVSYGFGVGGVSVSLGLNKTRQFNSSGEQRTDTVTSLYVSVPLDRWLSSDGSSVSATYQLTSSRDSDTNQMGLNGYAFDRQLNWDVQQRRQSGNNVSDRDNSALRMTWNGRYGQLSGNYSYSPHQRQTGGGIAGSMLIHQHGITFGQPLGDTVALVEAPGAAGVPVSGFPGVSTDFRGYTTKAFLSPYQENIISLDPTALPPNAEITQTDLTVVPTQGAVVPAKFSTRVGERALMTLLQPGGEAVPFGSVVSLVSGQGAGIVGDKGQVYLTGLPRQGSLIARWGDNKQCQVSFTLPDTGSHESSGGIVTTHETCR